jgi:hypothetical protein
MLDIDYPLLIKIYMPMQLQVAGLGLVAIL